MRKLIRQSTQDAPQRPKFSDPAGRECPAPLPALDAQALAALAVALGILDEVRAAYAREDAA